MLRYTLAMAAMGTMIMAAAAAPAVASAAAVQPAGFCVVFAQNEPLHSSPSEDSAVVGAITASRPGNGCVRAPGGSYTACGGGSLWVRTSAGGAVGYARERCVDIAE